MISLVWHGRQARSFVAQKLSGYEAVLSVIAGESLCVKARRLSRQSQMVVNQTQRAGKSHHALRKPQSNGASGPQKTYNGLEFVIVSAHALCINSLAQSPHRLKVNHKIFRHKPQAGRW